MFAEWKYRPCQPGRRSVTLRRPVSMKGIWVSLEENPSTEVAAWRHNSSQKPKFAKISCVDTAPGEPPALPFGTPTLATPSPSAAAPARRTTVRPADPIRFRFPFIDFGGYIDKLFSAGMQILLDRQC